MKFSSSDSNGEDTLVRLADLLYCTVGSSSLQNCQNTSKITIKSGNWSAGLDAPINSLALWRGVRGSLLYSFFGSQFSSWRLLERYIALYRETQSRHRRRRIRVGFLLNRVNFFPICRRFLSRRKHGFIPFQPQFLWECVVYSLCLLYQSKRGMLYEKVVSKIVVFVRRIKFSALREFDTTSE